MNYPHLAGRIFNTPLLIHPQKLDAMIAGLGGRLLGVSAGQIQHVGHAAQAVLAPEMFSTRRGERTERGYRVVEGVAVLSVSGVLVHRSRFDFSESSLILGYNDLTADLEDAMAHPDVHAVLMVYDSPGGEAQGAFEYAQRIFDLRGRKPLWAISDGLAASAAYLGASAVEQMAITSTGLVGSIGVVARHVDFSRALDAEGITVTHIFAGAHKVDGNPYEPLPEAVRKDWQAEIDNLYGMFIDAVATHRGIDARTVRATQAATYTGQAAVDARLVDRIATTDQLIAELGAMRTRSYTAGPAARATAVTPGATMSSTTQSGTQAATTFTQADLDAARAEGTAKGTQAERERTTAILGHEAAKGRSALAVQCVTSGLSVEQSAAVLAAAPVDPAMSAQGQGSQFAQHMAALGNPNVQGNDAPDAGVTSAKAVADSWDAAFGAQRH